MTAVNQTKTETETRAGGRLFGGVLVGVEGSEPGLEACRQAARGADPEAPIDVIAVVHVAEAVHTGPSALRVADELQRDAELALEHAVRLIGARARPHFVDGLVTSSLLREAERADATLIVVRPGQAA